MKSDVENILPLLEAKDNLFLAELRACKNSGFPTYIYGAGEGADNVIKRSNSIGIDFVGKLVDKIYYSALFHQDGVKCIEDVLSKERINLVVAFKGFHESKIASYRENVNILVDRDCFSGNYEVNPSIMTVSFVENNHKKITEIYNSLADEKSKRTLLAYINQKISMDYKYLRIEKSKNQYFDPEIVKLKSGETFLDAGAYVGDTTESFVAELHERGIENYEAIYSFEPDPANFKKLQSRKLNKFHAYCIATSDKKDKVFFQSKGKGSSSAITTNKSIEVLETDTIDNILAGKAVTFIKMDVEGCELSSLKGAEQTIKKFRPKLAICIYHKHQDLWKIQEYIASLHLNYKFFMRAYDDTATELLLYAIID